jgi:hypothetical protein
MTWQWTYDGTPNNSVNMTSTGGMFFGYMLKKVLNQAGWTTRMSSDGTADGYNSDGTSDKITSAGGADPGGLQHGTYQVGGAWYRLRAPDGSMELCYQTVDTGNMSRFRCKMSWDGFSAGSPTYLVTPQPPLVDGVSDEAVFYGSGPDSAPVYGAMNPGIGTYFYFAADNAAPYGFWAVTSGFLMFSLPLKAGSYSAADTAPNIVGCGSGPSNVIQGPTFYNSWNLFLGYGRHRHGLTGAKTVTYSASGATPYTGAINPYNGLDDLVAIQVTRSAHATVANTLPNWKGVIDPGVMCYRQATRSNLLDYVDIGAKRYVYMNDVALIFPQSIVPAGS